MAGRSTGVKSNRRGDTLGIGREGRRRESPDVSINEMRT